MRQLLLSLGAYTCTLLPEELNAYPDSLLARLAAEDDGIKVTSADKNESDIQEGALENSCLRLKLDGLPGSPLNDWPEALHILPTLYRKQALPATLLEQLLKEKPPKIIQTPQPETAAAAETAASAPSKHDVPPTSRRTDAASNSTVPQGTSVSQPGSSSNSASEDCQCHASMYKRFYDNLSRVLGFLGLPGPISSLLPYKDIQVTQFDALEFFYACIAYEAAELMLEFKPHLAAKGAFNHSNMAVFLITLRKKKPALSVHLLKTQSPGYLRQQVINTMTDPKALRLTVRDNTASQDVSIPVCAAADSVDMGRDPPRLLPLQRKSQAAVGTASELAHSAVGYQEAHRSLASAPEGTAAEAHPSLALRITEALVTAGGGTRRLASAICYIGLKEAQPEGRNNTFAATYAVPVWVLLWG